MPFKLTRSSDRRAFSESTGGHEYDVGAAGEYPRP
jgi:hypothetical protein